MTEVVDTLVLKRWVDGDLLRLAPGYVSGSDCKSGIDNVGRNSEIASN